MLSAEYISFMKQDNEKDIDAGWQPTTPQSVALRSRDFEILFGGARGGGKTDTGIAWLQYNISHPAFRGLVIRKNATDLSDWVDRAKVMMKYTRAVFVGAVPTIRFPSGAIVKTGHLKDENAYEKYQGHEYHNILLEEVEQIPLEASYEKLIASCRSTVDELVPQVFATGNPGGPGHIWLKKRFGLEGIPTKPIRTVDPVTGLSRLFVPAKLADNPYLSRDSRYKSVLMGLPEQLKKAWLHGSWDDMIVEGAYYTDALREAREKGRIKHLEHDPSKKVHTLWDLGVGIQNRIILLQRHGRDFYIIDHLIGSDEDKGIASHAQKLQTLQTQKGYVYGFHFLPHDAGQKEKGSGKTYVELAEPLLGKDKIKLVPRSKSVSVDIQKVLLLWSRIWISDELEDFINSLSHYRREYDEKRGDWKPTPLHDWASHDADTLRHLALVEDEIVDVDKKLPELPKEEDVPTSDFEGKGVVLPSRDIPGLGDM